MSAGLPCLWACRPSAVTVMVGTLVLVGAAMFLGASLLMALTMAVAAFAAITVLNAYDVHRHRDTWNAEEAEEADGR